MEDFHHCDQHEWSFQMMSIYCRLLKIMRKAMAFGVVQFLAKM